LREYKSPPICDAWNSVEVMACVKPGGCMSPINLPRLPAAALTRIPVASVPFPMTYQFITTSTALRWLTSYLIQLVSCFQNVRSNK